MVDTLYNPFTGADEIVVRDASGSMRVVRADAAVQVPPPAPAGQPTAPVVLRPITPPPMPARLPPRPVAVEGDDIVAVSRGLAAAAGVMLDDPGLVRRLANVVVSRVKDIRGQIEVLEILRRPVKFGGLDIAPALAEKLGRIIELQLPKLAGRGWTVPPPPPPPPTATPQPAAAAARVSPPPAVPRPSLAAAAPRAAVTPAPGVAAPVTSAEVVRAVPLPVTASPVTPALPSREESRGRRAPAPPALVGTEEELGRFTLVDFRHLDPSPAIAAAKIHALFNALDRESFARRAAGLSAWRSSELYALYTAMGSESMVAKQPMEAVAAQRVARGQPALTLAEFEAIMDLNQQLRF